MDNRNQLVNTSENVKTEETHIDIEAQQPATRPQQNSIGYQHTFPEIPFKAKHPNWYAFGDWLQSNAFGYAAAVGTNYLLPFMPLTDMCFVDGKCFIQWAETWSGAPFSIDFTISLLNSSYIHLVSQPNEFDAAYQKYKSEVSGWIRHGSSLVINVGTSLLAANFVRTVMADYGYDIDFTVFDPRVMAITAFAQTTVLSNVQSLLRTGVQKSVPYVRSLIQYGSSLWKKCTDTKKADQLQAHEETKAEYHALPKSPSSRV